MAEKDFWFFFFNLNMSASFSGVCICDLRSLHEYWRTDCCLVAKSCPTLQPHGLKHSRLPCLSTSPRVCSNSWPLNRWWHPTISSSVAFFSCLQSFPATGSFPRSELFASGGPSIGASASSLVLPMNIQGWITSNDMLNPQKLWLWKSSRSVLLVTVSE